MLRKCLKITVFPLCVLTSSLAHSAPRIVCDEMIYNFGNRSNLDTVKHQFIIRNEGEDPLKILKVRACCGAVATTKDKLIAKDGSTTIDVSLALHGRRGPQKKTIYVSTNDPLRPHLMLSLRGTAEAIIEINPVILRFGKIASDSQAERNSVLLSENETFNILSIDTPGGNISASAISLSEKQHRIDVKLIPPLPPGEFRRIIKVTTNNPKVRKILLQCTGEIVADLYTIPDKLYIGIHPLQLESTRNLSLHFSTSQPILIDKIHVPESVEAEFTSFSKEKGSIKVTFPRGYLPKENDAAVIHYIKKNRQETLRIPFLSVPKKTELPQ